jgi:predicted AAA+ superfamily ATPase
VDLFSGVNNLKRRINSELIQWKNKTLRKPLILRGARQVGKTYALKSFGARHYEAVHYFNFEKEPKLAHVFETNLDAQHIIFELEMLINNKINSGKDLIIFDEIQACPRALNSLKYFCEEMSHQHICAAGSLLGLVFSEESFSVGKIEYLDMYPMAFDEFVLAIGEKNIFNYIRKSKKPDEMLASKAVHDKIWGLLKWYYVVGGLPEAVSLFCKERENLHTAFMMVRKKQTDLISNYYADIAKHCGKINASHIEKVLRNVPIQLAKTQSGSISRFQFKDVIPGSKRFAQLEGPIQWLEKAGLIIKVPIVNHAEVPLSSYVKENLFKLYLFDIGLLGAISDLSYESLMQQDYGTYKGYFAENFVAQELKYSYRRPLYSWNENTAEIEFVCELRGLLLPIEVKSGNITQSKSPKVFCEKYKNIPKGLILSGRTINIEPGRRIDYWPLYFASRIGSVQIV